MKRAESGVVLKPCPSCGEQPTFVKDSDGDLILACWGVAEEGQYHESDHDFTVRGRRTRAALKRLWNRSARPANVRKMIEGRR